MKNNEMKIYRVEVYKRYSNGEITIVNGPEYYSEYEYALEMVDKYKTDDTTKYEDCHDKDFAHREIWIARGIKTSDFEKLSGLEADQYQIYIWQIQVKK